MNSDTANKVNGGGAETALPPLCFPSPKFVWSALHNILAAMQ